MEADEGVDAAVPTSTGLVTILQNDLGHAHWLVWCAQRNGQRSEGSEKTVHHTVNNLDGELAVHVLIQSPSGMSTGL